jgi:hypothetical protein
LIYPFFGLVFIRHFSATRKVAELGESLRAYDEKDREKDTIIKTLTNSGREKDEMIHTLIAASKVKDAVINKLQKELDDLRNSIRREISDDYISDDLQNSIRREIVLLSR